MRHVVSVEPAAVGTAGEAATRIAPAQRAPQLRGDDAGAPSARDDVTARVGHDRGERAVAGHAPKRLRGNVRAVLELGAQLPRRTLIAERAGSKLDDHLLALRRRARLSAVSGEERLGELNEPVGATRERRDGR